MKKVSRNKVGDVDDRARADGEAIARAVERQAADFERDSAAYEQHAIQAAEAVLAMAEPSRKRCLQHGCPTVITPAEGTPPFCPDHDTEAKRLLIR